MTLTPALKLLVIALAAVFGLLDEFWMEAQSDLVEGLGLNGHIYALVSLVLSKVSLGLLALLAYLGLKAPTLEKPPKDVE